MYTLNEWTSKKNNNINEGILSNIFGDLRDEFEGLNNDDKLNKLLHYLLGDRVRTIRKSKVQDMQDIIDKIVNKVQNAQVQNRYFRYFNNEVENNNYIGVKIKAKEIRKHRNFNVYNRNPLIGGYIGGKLSNITKENELVFELYHKRKDDIIKYLMTETTDFLNYYITSVILELDNLVRIYNRVIDMVGDELIDFSYFYFLTKFETYGRRKQEEVVSSIMTILKDKMLFDDELIQKSIDETEKRYNDTINSLNNKYKKYKDIGEYMKRLERNFDDYIKFLKK